MDRNEIEKAAGKESALEKVTVTSRDGIGTLMLNSPANLNAFDAAMVRDVMEALNILETDESVKVVVLCAAGKAFSGGGDIAEMNEGLKKGEIVLETTAEAIAQVSLKIKKMKKLVIASVSGAVAGAAFNIVLACDFCIAGENTKFIQAFVNIGLIPDAGGLYLLSRAVGVNKAMQLALTGIPVTAEEGKTLGFVYQTASLDTLALETEQLACKLSAGPLHAYTAMKELSYASQFQDFESYIKEEAAAQIRCGYTEDYREGVTAFLEKRKPKYTGS